MSDRPSGYLLLFRRSFDSEPLGWFADRAEAEARAREICGAYDPEATPIGAPPLGRGDIYSGPKLGIVSRAMGIALIPFVKGEPAEEDRCYFVPEPILVAARKQRKEFIA